MTAATEQRLSLPIEGMTCSSCANRIEKRLNQIDGVEATVNFATEQAAVSFDPARVEAGDLVAAIGETGYTASLPRRSERARARRRRSATPAPTCAAASSSPPRSRCRCC